MAYFNDKFKKQDWIRVHIYSILLTGMTNLPARLCKRFWQRNNLLVKRIYLFFGFTFNSYSKIF